MALDRDFPMTLTQVRVLVVGLAAMAAIGIALFGGFLPGLRPNYSAADITTVAGHRYYVESSLLSTPVFANSTAPWNVTFHNVTFELRLTNWYSLQGGIVHGNGTEANGTRYAFTLGELLPNGSRSTFFLSPDLIFAASWTGGWFGGPTIGLLVEVSYAPAAAPT